MSQGLGWVLAQMQALKNENTNEWLLVFTHGDCTLSRGCAEGSNGSMFTHFLVQN